MATTQKLLGEAVGIQFTGTRDETGTNPILGLTDGLIVGQFRRGRTDKPMRITQQNIRAELGYEPDNKFYQAVQAALDQFPFVWVLRVGSYGSGGGSGAGSSFSCEGATNTSGCIDIEGLWDLEIDGVRILSDVTPQQIESYLINESPHITNRPSCCPSGYYRSVHLPYPIQAGSTIYIPIALTPDGESITTPMIAQGPDPYNNIGEQLAIQLEPHGLYARNNMFSNAHSTSFGITYYNATNYNNTFFYILDEGNTFSEEQMPRGLPPYRCFFPS